MREPSRLSRCWRFRAWEQQRRGHGYRGTRFILLGRAGDEPRSTSPPRPRNRATPQGADHRATPMIQLARLPERQLAKSVVGNGSIAHTLANLPEPGSLNEHVPTA